MKYYFTICSVVFICSIFSICSLEAKKIDRRVDTHERKIEELFIDVQFLRERIEVLEERLNGTHEHDSPSSEEQAERLATASNCDQS